MTTPREIAYIALLSSLREERFLSKTLDKWIQAENPQSIDAHLAKEIAYGSMRMMLALDEILRQLSQDSSNRIKRKERALIYTALYQHYYMDRIPDYAIVNESVAIAKKYCHTRFASYLNVLLHMMTNTDITLPQDNLSVAYSYPPYFVETLTTDYGLEQAKEVMDVCNHSSPTMARVRTKQEGDYVFQEQLCVTKLNTLDNSITSSSDYYIQNVTPVSLMSTLKKSLSKTPNKILDLCSSPGGKLLCAHDLFPDAQLFANDVSEKKIERLRQNLDKYGVQAALTTCPGEEYPLDEKFDLIILDVPCSNSGVLHKRAEARWRISEEALKEFNVTQAKLLKRSKELLAPNGVIWYLTCSILKNENEALIQKAAKDLGLHVATQHIVLPNRKGWDGGFACSLQI